MTLVHNGIIENYRELIADYELESVLKSETDSEVVAALLNKFYTGDPDEAIKKTVSKLEKEIISIQKKVSKLQEECRHERNEKYRLLCYINRYCSALFFYFDRSNPVDSKNWEKVPRLQLDLD